MTSFFCRLPPILLVMLSASCAGRYQAADGASRDYRYLGGRSGAWLTAYDDAHGLLGQRPRAEPVLRPAGERWNALGPLGNSLGIVEVVGLRPEDPILGVDVLMTAWDIQRPGTVVYASLEPRVATIGWSPSDAQKEAAARVLRHATGAEPWPDELRPAESERRAYAPLCDSRSLFFRASWKHDVQNYGLVANEAASALVRFEPGDPSWRVEFLVEAPRHGGAAPAGAIDLDGDRHPEILICVWEPEESWLEIYRRTPPDVRVAPSEVWELVARGDAVSPLRRH